LTVCHLLECVNNNRKDDPHCVLTEIEVDTKKQCLNFIVDSKYRQAQGRERDKTRPWLKPNDGRIQSNGILIGEIQRLLVNAIESPCGGLLASEIRQGLLDKGIEAAPQKIVNVITYRGNGIKTDDITLGSKRVTMYSMEGIE